MWTRSQSDLLENALCILEQLFSSVGVNEGMLSYTLGTILQQRAHEDKEVLEKQLCFILR